MEKMSLEGMQLYLANNHILTEMNSFSYKCHLWWI